MYMMNDREFSNRKETLHGEFYENALKYPERIALIYENEKVSYTQKLFQGGVRINILHSIYQFKIDQLSEIILIP